jgi:hypothetical protein
MALFCLTIVSKWPTLLSCKVAERPHGPDQITVSGLPERFGGNAWSMNSMFDVFDGHCFRSILSFDIIIKD